VAATALHRDGYAVLAAAHGREALDLLTTYSGPIDILITDLDISKINAIELCNEAKKERPNIKACAISPHASGDLHAGNCGVPVLFKPLDPAQLRRQFPDLLP
jgi:CheY-like chemotaxis protein